MVSLSPGVRRLCVSVSTPYPGLLARACCSSGPRRIYLEHGPAGGADLGFASPGVDEAVLVPDLIAALHEAAAQAGAGCATSQVPTLAAFHVGITRIEGDDLRGTGVTHVRELHGELASAASRVAPTGLLVVGISAGLFDDIRTESNFRDGWIPLGTAGRAWCRAY